MTRPIAALKETIVAGAEIWLSEDWTPEGAAYAVVEQMRYPTRLAITETFSLDTLAESWQARLNKLAQDATVNVVPKFMEAAE